MKFSPTTKSATFAFSLIELAIVVAVLGVIAVIAMPNLFSARKTAEDKICIANLKTIVHAKEQWGFDNGKKETDEPDYNDIKPYLTRTQTQNICPIGGKYTIGPLSEDPSCEYAELGHEIDTGE